MSMAPQNTYKKSFLIAFELLLKIRLGPCGPSEGAHGTPEGDGPWDLLGPKSDLGRRRGHVALGPLGTPRAPFYMILSLLIRKGFKVYMFFDLKVILIDFFKSNLRFSRILSPGLFEAAGPQNTTGAED